MGNSVDLAEKIFLKGWRPYFWLLLLGFLIYYQTLHFNFVYFDDDILVISNQKFISQLSNIPQAFKDDVFLSFFDVYYRPLLTVSFIFDAQLSGGAPWAYHLTNLLLHLISTLLLYLLLKKLGVIKDLAFFFAAVFAVHPVLSQAVGWIPGRNDPLLALFLLSSFIFFLYFSQ